MANLRWQTRPQMRGLFWFLATALGVCLPGAAHAARPGAPGAASSTAANTLPPGTPPQGYRLADVVLRITRQAGHGLAPMQRVTLVGQGHSTRQVGEQVQHFTLPASDLLAIVNDLLKLQFFALPAQYSQMQSVFVRPDGTVGLGMTRMMDTANTEVCFEVPAYKKCVAYHHLQVPTDLDALVQRLLADAQRLGQR